MNIIFIFIEKCYKIFSQVIARVMVNATTCDFKNALHPTIGPFMDSGHSGQRSALKKSLTTPRSKIWQPTWNRTGPVALAKEVTTKAFGRMNGKNTGLARAWASMRSFRRRSRSQKRIARIALPAVNATSAFQKILETLRDAIVDILASKTWNSFTLFRLLWFET